MPIVDHVMYMSTGRIMYTEVGQCSVQLVVDNINGRLQESATGRIFFDFLPVFRARLAFVTPMIGAFGMDICHVFGTGGSSGLA